MQYWDDLDDIIGMIGLCAERIRRMLLFIAATLLYVVIFLTGVLFALMDPPLALAVATILGVQLAYRHVTAAMPPHVPA